MATFLRAVQKPPTQGGGVEELDKGDSEPAHGVQEYTRTHVARARNGLPVYTIEPENRPAKALGASTLC